MQFSKLGIVKFVVSSMVGIGTGKIAGAIIKNNINPVTAIDKVTVVGASWVIGMIAGEATKKYTSDQIDEVVKTATGLVAAIKDAKTLAKVNRKEITFEESGLDIEKYERQPDGNWSPIKETELLADK